MGEVLVGVAPIPSHPNPSSGWRSRAGSTTTAEGVPYDVKRWAQTGLSRVEAVVWAARGPPSLLARSCHHGYMKQKKIGCRMLRFGALATYGTYDNWGANKE